MKKSITLMLLFVMAISANAGLVLQTKGSIYVCPKVFNTSGKSVVYSINGDESVTIYTPDFLVDKTIIPPVQEYLSGSFTEEATVKATGVNVVPSIVYYEGYVSNNYSSYYQFEASSQEDMITKLKENNFYDTFTAFTDPMGNPACYNDSYASFKYENVFGKQYPTSWYALIDGKVYSISTYDDFYQLAYDEKSAVWTRTSENIETVNSSSIKKTYVYFEGMDEDAYGDIYITQNLFNNDDKWEYLVADYSGPSSIYYYGTEVTVNEDGTVTLKRDGYVSPESRGYVVYNEDEEKLGNIPTRDLYVINGKPYAYVYADEFSSYRSLYSFDKEGGDIDLVETVRVKGARRLDAMKGIVTVDINAEQAGGEVVVSTPDGKVMANKKVGIGQTQINSQPLPAGIYVVSLLKGGRVVESEKYLVK